MHLETNDQEYIENAVIRFEDPITISVLVDSYEQISDSLQQSSRGFYQANDERSIPGYTKGLQRKIVYTKKREGSENTITHEKHHAWFERISPQEKKISSADVYMLDEFGAYAHGNEFTRFALSDVAGDFHYEQLMERRNYPQLEAYYAVAAELIKLREAGVEARNIAHIFTVSRNLKDALRHLQSDRFNVQVTQEQLNRIRFKTIHEVFATLKLVRDTGFNVSQIEEKILDKITREPDIESNDFRLRVYRKIMGPDVNYNTLVEIAMEGQPFEEESFLDPKNDLWSFSRELKRFLEKIFDNSPEHPHFLEMHEDDPELYEDAKADVFSSLIKSFKKSFNAEHFSSELLEKNVDSALALLEKMDASFSKIDKDFLVKVALDSYVSGAAMYGIRESKDALMQELNSKTFTEQLDAIRDWEYEITVDDPYSRDVYMLQSIQQIDDRLRIEYNSNAQYDAFVEIHKRDGQFVVTAEGLLDSSPQSISPEKLDYYPMVFYKVPDSENYVSIYENGTLHLDSNSLNVVDVKDLEKEVITYEL